jgi:hypothetical protein
LPERSALGCCQAEIPTDAVRDEYRGRRFVWTLMALFLQENTAKMLCRHGENVKIKHKKCFFYVKTCLCKYICHTFAASKPFY